MRVKEQYVESTQISVNASVEVVCVQYVLCVYEHVYKQAILLSTKVYKVYTHIS